MLTPSSAPTIDVADEERFYTKGVSLDIAGWGGGVTCYNCQSPAILQQGNVFVSDKTSCSRLKREIWKYSLSNDVFCASSKSQAAPTGAGVCYGDSGGMVVARFLDRRVLVGIPSSIIDVKCNPNYPQVHTKVKDHLGWIGQYVNKPAMPDLVKFREYAPITDKKGRPYIQIRRVLIKNKSARYPLSLSSLTIKAEPTYRKDVFQISKNSCPLTLLPKKTCAVEIRFNPLGAGKKYAYGDHIAWLKASSGSGVANFESLLYVYCAGCL